MCILPVVVTGTPCTVVWFMPSLPYKKYTRNYSAQCSVPPACILAHPHTHTHTQSLAHTPTPSQKAMQLEDINDGEQRELKDKISRLAQENRNFESKVKSQKDQSKSLYQRYRYYLCANSLHIAWNSYNHINRTYSRSFHFAHVITYMQHIHAVFDVIL